jgi:transposase
VIESRPTVCLCCASSRLRKLGEDVTETLEVIPRQWKVIQHVREKFTCRDCEKISQAPAPLRDKPSTSQPGAPATDNQHYGRSDPWPRA